MVSDPITRQYESRLVEWRVERAWHEGWVVGYRSGTQDMRRANGNTVDETGQKEDLAGKREENERKPRSVRVGGSDSVPCEADDCIYNRVGEGHLYCALHECDIPQCHFFYRTCIHYMCNSDGVHNASDCRRGDT